MKVIQLKTYKVIKEQAQKELVYRHKIAQMDKASLLQELLNYHDSYQKNPHDLNVTIRAQHLMEVLESRAELMELKDLVREFNAKLKVRLYQQSHK